MKTKLGNQKDSWANENPQVSMWFALRNEHIFQKKIQQDNQFIISTNKCIYSHKLGDAMEIQGCCF
jgi:hypothetical protein